MSTRLRRHTLAVAGTGAKGNIAEREDTQIRAAMRQTNGSWKQMDITPDDGYVDQKPMVTIQEDGKAACIYEHGTLVRHKDVA